MKPTFKTLCDAAVTAGEMSEGTAEYFHGLYLDSAERSELETLRELVGVRKDAAACASDAQHWLKLMAAWDERVTLREELKRTLEYLIAWRADATKCHNQHLPIARLQALLGIPEAR